MRDHLIPLMSALRQWAEEHIEEVGRLFRHMKRGEKKRIIGDKSCEGGPLFVLAPWV